MTCRPACGTGPTNYLPWFGCYSCTSFQYNDGSQCLCAFNEYWNGGSCVSMCSSDQFYDGSNCQTCGLHQKFNPGSMSCTDMCSSTQIYIYPNGCLDCGQNISPNINTCKCQFYQSWDGSTCIDQCPASSGQFFNGSMCQSCQPYQRLNPTNFQCEDFCSVDLTYSISLR